MIGVDTNVLVRIFASDDAQQTASAIRVIDESKLGQIFVNVVVLAEFAWTMRRAYKWDDDWIRHALTRIVRHPALTIQHRSSVLEAITDSNGSFDRRAQFRRRLRDDADVRPGSGRVSRFPFAQDLAGLPFDFPLAEIGA
jgi:predicted nucleic-acid-binding protein